MSRTSFVTRSFAALLALTGAIGLAALAAVPAGAEGGTRSAELVTNQTPATGGTRFVYAVFHALDRDGFCQPPAGAVSLHPVLGLPVNFVIESGDGIIVATSSGGTIAGREAIGVPTFSTAVNAASPTPVKAFAPLLAGVADECQAWVKVAQSIPGPLRVLVTAGGSTSEGDLQFVADLGAPETAAITLTPGWTLVTWQGGDGMTPADALRGAGASGTGTDISAEVSAMYRWDAAGQRWQAYFPGSANIAGASDLAALRTGEAYWVALKGAAPVSWVMQASAQ
ncbi:MAG: hypothetical protein HYX53_07885 [Chloroflexi bacterium]|nr:hypothetical protein [Chloroflexota bacterium]